MAMPVLPVNAPRSYINVPTNTQLQLKRPAWLCRVIVTATGSAAMFLYDNALGDNSGNIIAALPASAAVGSIYDFEVDALLGISAPAVSGTPAIIVTYQPSDVQQ